MRILWIEDIADHVKRHMGALRRQGHEVTTSASGEKALQALCEARDGGSPFDLVLLDIMLPRGEGKSLDPATRPELMGIAVLEGMKSLGICCPVVCVTAVADDEVMGDIQTKYPFVSEVLRKPVTIEELLEAVSRAATPGAEERQESVDEDP